MSLLIVCADVSTEMNAVESIGFMRCHVGWDSVLGFDDAGFVSTTC